MGDLPAHFDRYSASRRAQNRKAALASPRQALHVSHLSSPMPNPIGLRKKENYSLDPIGLRAKAASNDPLQLRRPIGRAVPRMDQGEKSAARIAASTLAAPVTTSPALLTIDRNCNASRSMI